MKTGSQKIANSRLTREAPTGSARLTRRFGASFIVAVALARRNAYSRGQEGSGRESKFDISENTKFSILMWVLNHQVKLKFVSLHLA